MATSRLASADCGGGVMTQNGRVVTDRMFWLEIRRGLMLLEKLIQARHGLGHDQAVSFGWSLTWDALNAIIAGIERRYAVGQFEPTARSFDP